MEIMYYKSPIGNLEITFKDYTIISLKICNHICTPINETAFSNSIKMQLDEYFSGKRHIFSIKISPKGTSFQKLVWSELQKIPYGETKSYSDIAEVIGNKNAQRAVGSACNKNPIMIIIPCHRVISKNGQPGGFAYGQSIKRKLLESEAEKLTKFRTQYKF